MKHYVYIVSPVVNGWYAAPCKVGLTNGLRGRIATLQTAHWHKLGLVNWFELPDRHTAEFVEREFHAGWAEYRLRGEWFDIAPVDAVEGVASVVFSAFELDAAALAASRYPEACEHIDAWRAAIDARQR